MEPFRKTARHRRTGLILTATAAGMLGLSFAAVPLYDLLCRVTGYGGETVRAEVAPDEILDDAVTIRFDASTARGMPWNFRPLQREMTVRLGETGLAFYRAHNPTPEPVTGIASYNVVPHSAGEHFTKIECFCFTEQTLAPGESIDMPVSFFVDPTIREDPNARHVETITLSYTFFTEEE